MAANEQHMYVPFAGAIQFPMWFWLWAALGIRNEYQIGLSVRETVKRNIDYSRSGITYLNGRQIKAAASPWFSEIRYVETVLAAHAAGRSRHVAKPLRWCPPLRLLFRAAHNRVILFRR
jgi:hypothetical protein